MAATLPGNGGRKNYYICGVAQALHKDLRRRRWQMFGYFEREGEVESTIQL